MTRPSPADQYEAVIGIETHVQLKTKTKLFCGCLNNSAEITPNSQICPVCMGLPGSLPVLNEQAVWLALRMGLALHGQIERETKFDRKNYFYPDLPKGYQISQYDQPIIGKGWVEVPFEDSSFKVGITRAHLEEDAGKLVHPEAADYSLLDLNRAGTPLMEVVSEPDVRSAAQAKAYVREIYNIVRYADISDADLYRGNMRFDVNVSVRKKGDKKLNVRTEAKNLNSFRSVERASEYEINRQIDLLEKGQKVEQETRGWDEAKNKTISQRTKEEAHDYRYFPEPDLPPLVITEAMIAKAKDNLPRLPDQIRKELMTAGLDIKTSSIILANPYDVELLSSIKDRQQLVGLAKYLTGRIRAYRNDHPGKAIRIKAAPLVELTEMARAGEVGSSAADDIIVEILETGKSPRDIAKTKRLLQVSDEAEIKKIVDRVLKENPKAVEDYKRGNEASLQFLVGQVMKLSRGQANPQTARDLLLKKLR